MLKRISCDAFKEYGNIRPAIEFHNGLNAIVGEKGGSNSIGKSTFLMIIDFCFGGTDYIHKEANTIEQVGPHTIKFEFEFDGVSKYFKRSTNNPNLVEVCDCEYNQKSLITLENFKKGLLHYYHLESYDLSLREWLSPFFRIYNRRAYNETKPISATIKEKESEGITNILKMFRLYNQLKALDEEYNQKLDIKKGLEALKRTKAAAIASSVDERNELEKELQSLQKQVEELEHDLKTNNEDASLLEIEVKKQLKSELNKLRKTKSKLQNKLNNIEYGLDYDEKTATRRYQKLLEYFPDVNIELLKTLEKFHIEVASYIEEDAIESNEVIKQNISLIDSQIAELEAKLKEYKEIPNATDAYIKRHHELDDLISHHKEAIKNFDSLEKANSEFANVETRFNKAFTNSTGGLTNTLNTGMDEYNQLIRQDKQKYSPKIEFASLKSYSFYIPNDNGTGSRFKAVCLLDLTLLDKTDLPVLIHDSIMFTNIEDKTRADLMKIYASKTNKQIFVSIEDLSKCDCLDENNNIVRNYAQENEVLHLYEGEGALFGRQWNIKE